MALIVTGLGIGFLSKTLLNCMLTSKKIINSIISIVTYKDENINEFIFNLNINELMGIIKSMSYVKYNENESIKLCWKNINETLNKINEELHYIEIKLDYNNSIWLFKSFRCCKFYNSKERLIEMKNTLMQYVELLFKIKSYITDD
jgi:hypothetical protein